MKDFIELTSIYDGRKCCVRAVLIEAVIDNAPETATFAGEELTVKPSCRTVQFSGSSIDVMESYDEICSMIYSAEL